MESRTFRIIVPGHLDRGFSAGLDGVSLRHDGGHTTLEGLFVDQSHLYGLLDQLRGLGIEVTSFSTTARGDHSSHETTQTAKDTK